MNYRFIHIIGSMDPKYGGPPVVVANLAISQRKKGHYVSIISSYVSDKEFDDVDKEFNFLRRESVSLILHKAFSFYRISFKFLNIFFQNDPNSVFYFHGLYRWPSSIGAFICRLMNHKYVIRIHGSLDPYLLRKSTKGSLFYFFKKLSELIIDFPNLRKASLIHVTSANELKKLPNNLKRSSNIAVIPNGISIPPKDKHLDIRKHYKLNSNEKILLFLGRINEKKGIDILIDSFPKVFKQIENVSLLIIGPDNENYISKLKDNLSCLRKEIRSKIIFDKEIPRFLLKSYYSQANLYILPSHTENFGLTIVESIYYGTPAVITKNVDIYEDLYKKNLIGLVNKLNSENLALTILSSLKNKKLLENVKNNGNEIIKSFYYWENIANQIDHALGI